MIHRRVLAGVVALLAVLLVGPVMVIGEPAVAPVLAAKPDRPPRAPAMAGDRAPESRTPVVAAFGALGVLGGFVLVLAAVQRRRKTDEDGNVHGAVPAPNLRPPADFEGDPLLAALNRRHGMRSRSTVPADAPAWVKRMNSQSQSGDDQSDI